MPDHNCAHPKVFISYSWDSPRHKERVLELSNQLRLEGIDCQIDQYVDSPPEGWTLWMQKQIEKAQFVLVVCTESYKRRFDGEEVPGSGFGGRWEGFLTRVTIYNAGTLNKKALVNSGMKRPIILL